MRAEGEKKAKPNYPYLLALGGIEGLIGWLIVTRLFDYVGIPQNPEDAIGEMLFVATFMGLLRISRGYGEARAKEGHDE